MSLATPLKMMGAPGSPYTRKMRAILRYRHIPYRLIYQGSPEHQSLPAPKIGLLPTFYLPGDAGPETPTTDSTPLIRLFEQEFEGRGVVPGDPVLAFLDALIEDYGDEWLTKAMFHYRWAYPADVEKAASILPLWSRINTPDAALEPFKKMIAERQISRLGVVGSNEVTAPVIEASYLRLLHKLDAHLQTQPFLLGERPSSCDFAIYGQLTCLVGFDPTPAAICVRETPRICAWVETMEDLSGLECDDGGWISRDAVPDTLRGILGEVGRVYAPYLVANAEAIADGRETLEASIDDRRWTQKPFPYQAKCLRWLRERYAALTAEDRSALDKVLAGTGCEALFSS